MHFDPLEAYHLYNRGNNKQLIFFNRDNYIFFLKKVRAEWTSYCDVLAYCLMPNHFHFLIVTNKRACEFVSLNSKETHMQRLSKTIGKTLSSYTQAINRQENRIGNLFQNKTKAKQLTNCELSETLSNDYLTTCVHYIHYNPYMSNLVNIPTDWEFSSFRDYAGIRNGKLCNQKLLFELSGLDERDFKSVLMPVPKIRFENIF